ncbi:MAG: hypothetical protein WAQ57_04145 [Candidatus Saccharimonadales bacterium]
MERVTEKVTQTGEFFRRYVVIICFVIFGAMYGYLVFTSSNQAARNPSDAEINERLQASKRTKLDDSAAKALQELSDQSVEIQSLFDDARNNPFSE